MNEVPHDVADAAAEEVDDMAMAMAMNATRRDYRNAGGEQLIDERQRLKMYVHDIERDISDGLKGPPLRLSLSAV